MALTVDETNGRMALIRRDAGPTASVSIELIGCVNCTNEWKSNYQHPDWEVFSDGNGKEVLRAARIAAVQVFVDKIRDGTAFRTSAPGDDELSLNGAEAALQLMDEVQLRAGTRGALIVRGRKPDHLVPPPPDMAVVYASAPPRPLSSEDAEWIASEVYLANMALLEPQGCDRRKAYALTDEQALVIFECYWKVGPVFRASRTQPRTATRVILDAKAGKKVPTVSLAYYSPDYALLSHVRIHDASCGEMARWVFDGEEFHLYSYSSMNQCVGLMPGEWPDQWRSQVVRIEQ